MPVFELQVKATLENVASFYAPDTMFWKVKFTCSSCNEPSKTLMQVSAQIETELGKAKANLVSKCHFCGRSRTVCFGPMLDDNPVRGRRMVINISKEDAEYVENVIVPKSSKEYGMEDQPNFKAVLQLDCRGMEPTEFSPEVRGMEVRAESGEVFSDVDLTEKEWVDYDNRKLCPVGVYSLEYKFVKA